MNDRGYFMDDSIGSPKLTADNEVEPATLAMLADHQLITPREDFSLLLTLARRFEGKKLVFFNSTAQGGGVAYKYRFFDPKRGNAPALDVFVACVAPFPCAFSSSSPLQV
jgi:hypothetical protein